MVEPRLLPSRRAAVGAVVAIRAECDQVGHLVAAPGLRLNPVVNFQGLAAPAALLARKAVASFDLRLEVLPVPASAAPGKLIREIANQVEPLMKRQAGGHGRRQAGEPARPPPP